MVGEHIRALKGGSWVHAIDCGDETVLHLAGETPARIRRAYRPEFLSGSECVEVVTHRERTFPAKEVVRRAYSRASDPALAAMFADSAAFAEWCKTGRLSGPRNVATLIPALPAQKPEGSPPAEARPKAARPTPRKRPPARKAAAKVPAKRAKGAAKAKAARPKRPARPKAKAKSKAKTPARKARRSRR